MYIRYYLRPYKNGWDVDSIEANIIRRFCCHFESFEEAFKYAKIFNGGINPVIER